MNFDNIKHFKSHEFDSADAPGSGDLMNQEFVERLDAIRDAVGMPLAVLSGFRTPAHNVAVGGEPNSAHLRGYARGMTQDPSQERIWTAALTIIGDEILSGRTQDKNVAQIAAWLNVQGIRLAEVRVVADKTEAIVEAVNILRARNDYLFTTGGIGPTHDDITVDAIAEALGVAVEHHPRAMAVLEAYYATRGGLTEARARMARVPVGADLIDNKVSGAPGIRIGNIFIMAGVPHITAGMLDALTGTLEGGRPVVSKTIGCWVAESEVADLLRDAEKNHEGVAIGSYPFFRDGRTGANFVVRSSDEALVDRCLADLTRDLEATGRIVTAQGI